MIVHKPKTVGILLFPAVEELDFAGPYEVFANARDEGGEAYCHVITLATEREVRCQGGLRVLSDGLLEECPALDLLVVPGGPGARNGYRNIRISNFLRT